MNYNVKLQPIRCDVFDDESHIQTPFDVRPVAGGIGYEPFWMLGFDGLAVYTSVERLTELRDAINAAFAAQTIEPAIEDIVRQEEAAEQAIEDRDALETGANRCPPRE